MRAVNLIPTEQRGGAPVGAGRSGGAAYAVLALFAAVALMALLYGKASRQVSSNKSKAATLSAEAQRAQSEASALAPYASFIALRETREQAVASLVDTRFDWAHALHEFGRVLTNQVSINSLDGTIASKTGSSSAPAPTVTSTAPTSSASASPAPAAAAPAASSVSSATPEGSVPTFTIAGCATSQRIVAETMQRLRLIDGVSEVTLASSTRSGSSGAAGSSTAGGCAATDPVFQLTVSFDPLPAAATSAAATSKAKTVAAIPFPSSSGGAG